VFVLNPDPYLLPSYRISPFQTKDLHTNNELPVSDAIDDYFSKRFKERDFLYTADGRNAIHIALQHYNLQPDDKVTILTSSGNFYISSCVTKEIEKFCKWSRQIEPATKLIFVNHEFGYPYENISELKKYKLPIVEDCCHSFFSTDGGNEIGVTGDFAIYSFPKMFPMQVGGLLTIKKDLAFTEPHPIDSQKLRYIKNVLSHHIGQREATIEKRFSNYRYLDLHLNKLGIAARFISGEGAVPGVYLFTVKNEEIDLPGLKIHLTAQGIQCSVFYGEAAFFIPVHQNLELPDLDYFIEAISFYLK
jgi:hypothetical protein